MLIETHVVVHTKGGKVWMTLESPPDDHCELLKRCDFHLAYMEHGLLIDLVQHKNPLVIVDSTEDVKTVELRCLTCDENETVDSIVFKGLGFAKRPSENTGIPFIKDLLGLTIKKKSEQETDPIPQDNFQEEENKEPSVESSPSSKGETGREEEKTLYEPESLPPKLPVHQENVSTTEQTKRDLFD